MTGGRLGQFLDNVMAHQPHQMDAALGRAEQGGLGTICVFDKCLRNIVGASHDQAERTALFKLAKRFYKIFRAEIAQIIQLDTAENLNPVGMNQVQVANKTTV